MPFTDFPNGLSTASDYLTNNLSANAQLSSSVANVERFMVPAEIDFNLKEIICSLLAGRGLKLPNIQICISFNLKELLRSILGTVSAAIYNALSALDAALDRFLEHLRIDAVLGRLNNLIAQASTIANMINFCSAPVDPVAIPNVLGNALQSFLGAGKSIMDRIGQILPDQIGGCLIDGQFNCGIFSGGLLKDVCDNLGDLNAIENSIVEQSTLIITDIDDLIDSESNVPTNYESGGSDISETPTPTNTGIGCLFNPGNDFNYVQRIGSNLYTAAQQLDGYQLTDANGNTVTALELICDDNLLRLLRRPSNPTPEIAEQVPIFNYCGEIVGYQKIESQSDVDVSVGAIPGPVSDPGYKAGGRNTIPELDAIAQAEAAGGGTVNQNITNITNLDGGVLFVANLDGLLNSGAVEGQIVYREDINVTYVRNSNTTGTIADYNVIGGDAGSSTLGPFLTAVNSGIGSGIMVRNGDDLFYRSLQGTTQQITVLNASAVSSNPIISLANNPVIPGTDSVTVPAGTTAQRSSTTNGAFRYNSTTGQFEGYQSGIWQSFATGASGVTNGTNIGGGSTEIFKQNAAGVLEFRTIESSGAITIGTASDLITISETLSATNLGAGAEIYTSRSGNNLQLRSINAGNGISVTQNANDITISDNSVLTATTTTTTATPATVISNTSLAVGNAWYFEIQATAKRTDSGSHAASIKLEGIIDNTTGTYNISVDSANKTIYSGVGTTTGLDVIADDNGGAGFRVQVTGRAAETYKWAIRVKYHEV